MIFRQQPKFKSNHHFGSRLVFARDGNLFVTTGERNSQRDKAQDLGTHIGKVVRITPDGGVPADNPFVGREARCRRSGPMGTATCRARRCIRRPASSGPTSTARAAATRSTSRAPGATTAGR